MNDPDTLLSIPDADRRYDSFARRVFGFSSVIIIAMPLIPFYPWLAWRSRTDGRGAWILVSIASACVTAWFWRELFVNQAAEEMLYEKTRGREVIFAGDSIGLSIGLLGDGRGKLITENRSYEHFAASSVIKFEEIHRSDERYFELTVLNRDKPLVILATHLGDQEIQFLAALRARISVPIHVSDGK